MAVTEGQRQTFIKYRERGCSIPVASAKAGFHPSTGKRIEAVLRNPAEWTPAKEAGGGVAGQGMRHTELVAQAKLPGPIPLDKLCAEAKAALRDFDYFRRRYFGRVSSPWQLEAIDELTRLVKTDDREFADMNEAPGLGKSTLLADFKSWLICQDRTIRMLVGSATQPLARRQMSRTRRALERMTPLRGDPKLIELGLALDCTTTLARDFGRFKPLDREAWNQDAIIVMQHEGMGAIEEKEPTLSAYGIGTEFTGGRFNFVEWDDLISPELVASAPYREGLEQIYVKTCEPRLEPGGLMILSGQRLASDDLHRFVLDMVSPSDDEDEDDDTTTLVEGPREDRSNMKYKHIVFKAHYDELCKGKETHAKSSPPYPVGCLLDPRRLPWKEVRTMMANNEGEFLLVYQQQDADPDKALVPRAWINGDGDFVGCLDHDRDLWEIPADPRSPIGDPLSYRDGIVFATADPSPTMYWSVQCWFFHLPTNQLILLDHVREKMKAPEMLERNAAGQFVGLMERWQRRSEAMGFPIGTWIIEENAAQRFMLQYSFVRDWRIAHGVDIKPHTTVSNKADPNYGVWTMQQPWRLGRVRLPMKHGDAAIASTYLIKEVVVYPKGRTDDCVMAMWMGWWNLPDLSIREDILEDVDRPAWVMEMAF